MRFYREENKIHIEQQAFVEGTADLLKEVKQFPSINAAKRESRAMQKGGSKFVRFHKLV